MLSTSNLSRTTINVIEINQVQQQLAEEANGGPLIINSTLRR